MPDRLAPRLASTFKHIAVTKFPLVRVAVTAFGSFLAACVGALIYWWVTARCVHLQPFRCC